MFDEENLTDSNCSNCSSILKRGKCQKKKSLDMQLLSATSGKEVFMAAAHNITYMVRYCYGLYIYTHTLTQNKRKPTNLFFLMLPLPFKLPVQTKFSPALYQIWALGLVRICFSLVPNHPEKIGRYVQRIQMLMNFDKTCLINALLKMVICD